MLRLGANKYIIEKREIRKQQQRIRRTVVLGLIMITGLCIMNWKSMFASQADMKASADAMSRYIIAEAQLQGEKADFKEICKYAKKLDETGLRVTFEEGALKTTVYFFKVQDPSPIQVAVLEIPSKR
jgi:hypothetical protein